MRSPREDSKATLGKLGSAMKEASLLGMGRRLLAAYDERRGFVLKVEGMKVEGIMTNFFILVRVSQRTPSPHSQYVCLEDRSVSLTTQTC